jgi:hypothetical protein
MDPLTQELLLRAMPSHSKNEGNIDLEAQPRVLNPNGSVSTVDSMSFGLDGQEVLLPSVVQGGFHLSNPDAVLGEYLRTGRYLGKYPDPLSADLAGDVLHKDYAHGRFDRGKPALSINNSPIEMMINHATTLSTRK